MRRICDGLEVKIVEEVGSLEGIGHGVGRRLHTGGKRKTQEDEGTEACEAEHGEQRVQATRAKLTGTPMLSLTA